MRRWSHEEADKHKFSPEVRARAVRMVLEHEAEHARSGRRSCRSRPRSAARRETLRAGCARPSVTGPARRRPTDERERIKALEREIRELRQANEILRKASAYFAQAELDRRSKP